MTLRRYFRKTIDSAAITYATVESVAGNKVTVRLVGTDGRMTNLTAVGDIPINEGDRVIVDYSAGITPVVRGIETHLEPGESAGYSGELPGGIGVESTDLDQEQTEEEVPFVEAEDVGVKAVVEDQSYEGDPYDPILHTYDPRTVNFGYNRSDWKSCEWDTHNMYGPLTTFGPTEITIPKDGKYIVDARWDKSIHDDTQYHYPGFSRLTVYLNGTTEIAAGYGVRSGFQWTEGCRAFRIVELQKGDKLSMTIWHTYPQDEYQLEKWDTGLNSETPEVSLTIQLVPGSNL